MVRQAASVACLLLWRLTDGWMSDITVITPVAGYHNDVLERAAASVQGQTVRCQHVVFRDEHRRGAGWARNQALEQVRTRFVVFLDADDWLEPTFAQETLAQYEATRRYVYTDWYADGQRVEAPVCAWTNRTAHLITTLLPTAWARAVGGFDEQWTGGEDTAFYMALVMRRLCGVRLARPLLHYGAEGQRSKAFMQGTEYARLQAALTARWGGQLVACCNGSGPIDNGVQGQPEGAGDVLAQALYAHNHTARGRATGRLYPYACYPDLLWVDPRDVEAGPNMFSLVQSEAHEEPSAVHMLAHLLANAQGHIGIGKPVQALPAEESAPLQQDRSARAVRVAQLSRRS